MQILCPTDGSPGASVGLDKVIASFEGSGLIVDLLAVAERRLVSPGATDGASAKAAAAVLASEPTRLEQAGVQVELAPTSLLVARS